MSSTNMRVTLEQKPLGGCSDDNETPWWYPTPNESVMMKMSEADGWAAHFCRAEDRLALLYAAKKEYH